MRNGMKSIFVAVFSLVLMRSGLSAAEPKGKAAELKEGKAAEVKQSNAEFKDEKDKVSYSFGMSLGASLKRAGFDLNIDTMAEAMKDVLSGKETKLTQQQAQQVQSGYQKELAAKRDQERHQNDETNRIE